VSEDCGRGVRNLRRVGEEVSIKEARYHVRVVIGTNMIDEDNNLTLGFGLKIRGKGFMNFVHWCSAYQH